MQSIIKMDLNHRAASQRRASLKTPMVSASDQRKWDLWAFNFWMNSSAVRASEHPGYAALAVEEGNVCPWNVPPRRSVGAISTVLRKTLQKGMEGMEERLVAGPGVAKGVLGGGEVRIWLPPLLWNRDREMIVLRRLVSS